MAKSKKEKDLDTSINPYKVLGLNEKDTESIEIIHIKRAYRREALIWHPDKVTIDKKEIANEKFKEIALSYSVLIDPTRRSNYDKTGSISEANDNDEKFSWKEFFDNLYKNPISKDLIQEDKEIYRSSGQEYNDIITWYKKSKGDLTVIFDNVIHCEVLDDYDRFVDIINNAIKDGELTSTGKWQSESQEKKQSRMKKAKREAKAAEKQSKKLHLTDNNNNNDTDLSALIQKKCQDRYENMIAALEDKYVKPPSKRKATSAPSKSRKK